MLQLVVVLTKNCCHYRKGTLQEPCQIVKPEDTSLMNDDYWLHLAEQLERERSISVWFI